MQFSHLSPTHCPSVTDLSIRAIRENCRPMRLDMAIIHALIDGVNSEMS